jgi:hypothetical protein
MKRLFGMIPASETKISKKYQAGSSFATVESCDFGWSVIWADGSASYEDVESSTENNFQRGLEFLKEYFPDAEEVVDSQKIEQKIEI